MVIGRFASQRREGAMPDYWHLTHQHFEKATALLATGDDDDLTYACLELRKSLEAYAYSLLQRYLSEVPLRAVETWQADKVLKELLAIDPKSASSYTLSMQRSASETDAAGPWVQLGEDRRLPVDYLRKTYQALGSFLHVPTIRQSGGSGNLARARERAVEVHERLSKILAPARIIGNLSTGIYHFNCTECEAPIARRRAFLAEGGSVECGNCGQGFDTEVQGDGGFFFIPLSFSWDCPRCQSRGEIVRSKAKDGLDVSCTHCQLLIQLHFKQSWHLAYDNSLFDQPSSPG